MWHPRVNRKTQDSSITHMSLTRVHAEPREPQEELHNRSYIMLAKGFAVSNGDNVKIDINITYNALGRVSSGSGHIGNAALMDKEVGP